MQSAWTWCKHGSRTSRSPGLIASMQITHIALSRCSLPTPAPARTPTALERVRRRFSIDTFDRNRASLLCVAANASLHASRLLRRANSGASQSQCTDGTVQNRGAVHRLCGTAWSSSTGTITVICSSSWSSSSATAAAASSCVRIAYAATPTAAAATSVGKPIFSGKRGICVARTRVVWNK